MIKVNFFTWTATADEILAKVRLVEANIKKLVDNNAKVKTVELRDTRSKTWLSRSKTVAVLLGMVYPFFVCFFPTRNCQGLETKRGFD
jgi:hypothetical protein